MRLYSGSSHQFIEDTVQNQIATKLRNSFLRVMGHAPSTSEVASWSNSLRATAMVIQHADLMDHGIVLEYQIPLTSRRLDCIVCGRDSKGSDNAVIIELKQWTECQPSDGENEVETRLGGGRRELLHPSVQANRYKRYLQDVQTVFYEPQGVALDACAYLHNYHLRDGDPLVDAKFGKVMEETPVFTADDVPRLEGHLVRRLSGGQGLEVLSRVEESRYRPSKKLMDHVGDVIGSRSEFVLMDDQLVVYDRILSSARAGFHDSRKTCLVVRGGPGTGKSVIAINVMAALLKEGYNAQYATGSRAFTGTLRKKVGARGAIQFKYFNSYTDAELNSVDVLIADESHRIRKSSSTRFTRREERSHREQIEELLDAAKVAVFFIDDDQVVRPTEIGSTQYIRDHAAGQGSKVFEYTLETQFRCAGSDAFVNWINHTLGIRETGQVFWMADEAFDFRILDDPAELESAIRGKASQGMTARMTAGFCWSWSDPKADGTLVEDVVIGNYKRPWNAKPDGARLARGIPSATTWAYDKEGIDQVGCIYTAQGFEFDYVGVIFGSDLRYNPGERRWEGHPESSFDTAVKRSREGFTNLVKNTYRVLLTRGLKGCYVYFEDDGTREYFASRMEPGSDGPTG